MPTIMDTLAQLGQDMRDAIASVRGILSQVSAIRDDAAARTTTIITNFINRPPQFTIYCDPVNGNDANDGTSIVLARKSLDAVLAGLGANAAQIFLLGDTVLRQKNYTFAPVAIFGIQPAANANGYILFRRTISFLGTATNSPDASGNTFSAGIFCNSPLLRAGNIDWALPDVPAGLTFRPHIYAFTAPDLVLDATTVTVGSANASALIGTSGRVTLTASVTFGAGAPGHLFDGVAAGADPNAQWRYASNIKSA